MFKFKSEPIDKQTVLEDSFALYKQTLCLSLPYSAVIACFTSLPILLIFTLPWPRFGLILLAALCEIIAFVSLSALIFKLYCFCSSVPCTVKTAVKQALIKLPTLLFLAIVYSIIVLSGTMLLIVPGVILAFSLLFSFILVLTDNQTMLQTLIASHRLVWGHWWHSFSIICIPLLLNIILSLTCFIIVGEVAIYGQLSLMTTALILAPINVFIQMLMIPLILSVLLVLLHDLRQRKAQQIPPWN